MIQLYSFCMWFLNDRIYPYKLMESLDFCKIIQYILKVEAFFLYAIGLGSLSCET